MACHMVSDFRQGLTHRRVRVQYVVVFSRIPFTQRRQFLGNGSEQTNDDANGSRFHVIAELGDNRGILNARVRDVQLRRQKHLPGHDNDNQIASLPKHQAGWSPP